LVTWLLGGMDGIVPCLLPSPFFSACFLPSGACFVGAREVGAKVARFPRKLALVGYWVMVVEVAPLKRWRGKAFL